jgi:hypothetical protein
VQATPRNARIDVENVCHVVVNIGPSMVSCIATKERTSLQDILGLPIGRLGASCTRAERGAIVLTRCADPPSTSCFMATAARSSLLSLASFDARVFAPPDPAWREYGGG